MDWPNHGLDIWMDLLKDNVCVPSLPVELHDQKYKISEATVWTEQEPLRSMKLNISEVLFLFILI
jgi:hypothetical protein